MQKVDHTDFQSQLLVAFRICEIGRFHVEPDKMSPFAFTAYTYVRSRERKKNPRPDLIIIHIILIRDHYEISLVGGSCNYFLYNL